VDQSSITFHMRPEARFSDGTPLTAEDVVFSHNLLVEQGLPSYAAIADSLVAEVEALDDHTVRWTVAEGAEPKDAFSLAGGTPVWSSAWFESTGARLDETSLEVSPGSGAYVLDSYEVNRRVVYVRDPDYWGADLPINVGRNNFDRIRVEYFADADVAFEAFTAGQYTFRQESSSLVWATRYDFPALDEGWVVRAELPERQPAQRRGHRLQPTRAQVPRPARPAGVGANVQLRLHQRDAAIRPFRAARELLAEQRPRRPGRARGARARAAPVRRRRPRPGSPDRARDDAAPVLARKPACPWRPARGAAPDGGSGLGAGADGALVKDGERFTVEILLDAPTIERVLTPYADNLRRLVGDDAVTVNVVDPAQYTQRERGFDWEIIYDGYVNYLEESSGLNQRYGSEGLGDLFNSAGFSHPAVDRLIEVVAAADSREEMAAGVRAIDRILRRELFIVPTWYNPDFWVAYYDMYDHPEPAAALRAWATRLLVVRRGGGGALPPAPSTVGRSVGRLHPPPPAAGDPDAARDHDHQLRLCSSSPAAHRADHRRDEGVGRRLRDIAAGRREAESRAATSVGYAGARGLPPEFIAELERQFGFDKPPSERFLLMMWDYSPLRLRRVLVSARRRW
jgi:microcin C transport system substrate-binding protein